MSRRGHDAADVKHAGWYGITTTNLHVIDEENKHYKGKKFKIDSKYLTAIFIGQIILVFVIVTLLSTFF